MRRQANLESLRKRSPLIAASMLKCDFGNLHREVEMLESAPVGVLHWDVMDGHFVPNLSYGAMVIEPIRTRSNCLFDVHLMMSDPGQYLDDFIRAGCDAITFHIEAVPEPAELLDRIHQADVLAGLALNPNTPVAAIEPYLEQCDLVLVMSVEPGFGGQTFQPSVLPKVQELRALGGEELLISIDGGIGPTTIESTLQAGCDLFVVGSAIFDRSDYQEAVEELAAVLAVQA